jgi:hypothetical protein
VQWPSEPLTLGGTLTVNLLAGSEALTEGDSFDLLSDNLAGSFSSVNLPTLAFSLKWDQSSLESNGIISVRKNGTVFKFL